MSSDSEKLFSRYEELRSYLGWTEDDRRRLSAVRDILEPRFSGIVDDFYAAIGQQPNIRRVLTGGAAQLDRLKETLTSWLCDLFSVPHDEAYVGRHYRAGYRHVEIGLEQSYVNGGLSHIRAGLMRALFAESVATAELAATVESLNKALDLDLTLIDLAYQHAAEAGRERAAEQLQTALKAADAASQSKSAFLANMSHEIRSPMHVIIGMTELLLDTQLSREQQDRLKIVQDSSEALLALINDILDYSRIEQDRLELEEIEFDLTECISATVKALAVQAHTKGLELVADVQPDLPDRVIGDPYRFRQILVNLVGNAIKFTMSGEVVIRVESSQSKENRLVLIIEVADTGMGVQPEKRNYIFDAFEQSDPSFARKFGGTGLGLAITSKLLGLMHGSIGFESELDIGTTFTITVPFRTAPPGRAEKRAAANHAARLRGARVLVLDDNASSCLALRRMLQSWHLEVDIAASLDLANALLQRTATSGSAYDVTLIDADIRAADGVSAAERDWPDEAGSTVLMLTSEDTASHVKHAENGGFSSWRVKPISPSDLFDTLNAVLTGKSEPTAPARNIACDARTSGLRILVAEDQHYNQILATDLLKKAGHTATIACNGRKACELAASGDFDLVLMDVRMPEMDGLQATRQIRHDEENTDRHIPIVAMTAEAMNGDAEHCIAAGMDAYLAKPIRSKELFETIDSFFVKPAAVQLPLTEIPIRTSEPQSSAADVQPVVAEPAIAVQGGVTPFDWSAALDAVNGDRKLLQKIVRAFLDDYTSLLKQLEHAHATNDRDTLQLVAHGLKGAMRTFNAKAAGEIAARLEAMARDDECRGATETVSALRREVEYLVPQFAVLAASAEVGSPSDVRVEHA